MPNEQQTDRTGGPRGGGMQEVNEWGNQYAKRVQAHMDKQQERMAGQSNDKQPEKTKDEQTRDKEARIRDLAEKLSPNQQAPDRQRDREQER